MAELQYCWQHTINRDLFRPNLADKLSIENPYELTELQAQEIIDICRQLLEHSDDDTFRRQIITADEEWVFFINPDETGFCLS